MKLFSRMLTRKPTEEEAMGNIDLDLDGNEDHRPGEAVADDSGRVNPTRVRSSRAHDEAYDPFSSGDAAPIGDLDEEPEEAEGAGWAENPFAADADWEDDTDWDDDGFGADLTEEDFLKEEVAEDEVAEASPIPPGVVGSVGSKSEGKDWESDDAFGRRAIARSRIGSQVEGAEDRLMDETDNKFGEKESTRRRSAMAHLKAAAAATKADKVLSHVVGRDPTLDPEEQSPYRDDLAKVVRPQSGSRPISRPASKSQTVSEPWDEGASDEDAALFAAASEASSSDEAFDPLAHVPENLSAEDFEEDDIFTGNYADEFDDASDEVPMEAAEEPRPVRTAVTTAGVPDAEDPFDDDDFADPEPEASADKGYEEEDEDFDGPVPSTAVAEAIAIANGEIDFEDDEDDESFDDADDEAIRSQLAGFTSDADKLIETTNQSPEAESYVNVATAVSAVPPGRVGRGAGRVKTRLLGFQPGDEEEKDVFEAAKEGAGPASTEFPVGWIIVLEGPGRGKCFTLFNGVSNIGRGEDQAVRLDFGDTSISRNNHAAVAFDIEQGKFFLGHGGKSNLVRLNEKPVLSTEEMSQGDEIRIGETTLKFVALCGPEFSWAGNGDEDKDVNE